MRIHQRPKPYTQRQSMAGSITSWQKFAGRAAARLARSLFWPFSTAASSLRRRFKVVNLTAYGLFVGVATSCSNGTSALIFVTHLLRTKYSRLPGGPRGFRMLARSAPCLPFLSHMPRKPHAAPYHMTKVHQHRSLTTVYPCPHTPLALHPTQPWPELFPRQYA
jgi:hypothetical protein